MQTVLRLMAAGGNHGMQQTAEEQINRHKRHLYAHQWLDVFNRLKNLIR